MSTLKNLSFSGLERFQRSPCAPNLQFHMQWDWNTTVGTTISTNFKKNINSKRGRSTIKIDIRSFSPPKGLTKVKSIRGSSTPSPRNPLIDKPEINQDLRSRQAYIQFAMIPYQEEKQHFPCSSATTIQLPLQQKDQPQVLIHHEPQQCRKQVTNI